MKNVDHNSVVFDSANVARGYMTFTYTPWFFMKAPLTTKQAVMNIRVLQASADDATGVSILHQQSAL